MQSQFDKVQQFKSLGEEVGKELTTDNVNNLKRLLQQPGGSISPDTLNALKDGKQLWTAMLHKNIFNRESVDKLGELMKCIERQDLYNKIEEYRANLLESKFATKLVMVDEPVAFFYKTVKSGVLWEQFLTGQVTLITGPSGSGKTQLTLQCAKEFRQQASRYSVIYLIPASDAEELLIRLYTLSDKLKILKQADGQKDKLQLIKIALKGIFDKLSSQKSVHLLMLENLNDTILFQMIMQNLDNPDYAKIKLIITSNNQNMQIVSQNVNHIDVQGFSKDEVLGFFYQHKNKFADTKEEDILSLAENLSYLPLGLAPAKFYILGTKITPKSYLDLLTDAKSNAILEKNEKRHGFLSGYNLSVLKALQMSISKCRELLNDENLNLMFEVSCLFNHQDIPLDILSTVLSAKNRNLKVDDLISCLSMWSLASVTVNGEIRTMTIHRATQHATRLTWSDEKRVHLAETTLLLLCRNFDKDTRFIKQFSATASLVQHVSEALNYTGTFLKPELFETSGSSYKNAVVARILLLDVLGYSYTQTGQPELSEEPLREAKDTLYNLIHFKTNANNPEEAHILYQKLSQLSMSLRDSDILSLVLNRHLTEQDLQIIKGRMVGNSDPLSEQLSQDNYDTMVHSGAAIPIRILNKIFLPEIMVSILYSHGRIYFYMKDKCNGDSDGLAKKSVFFKDMQIAHELSKAVYCDTDSKFHILHEALTLRNAVLYIKLEELDVLGKNKPVANFKDDILKARQTYVTLANDTNDYYQFGILKTKKGDSYGKMICLRQILQCYKLLQKIDPNSQDVIQETRKHVKSMLKLAETFKNMSSLLPNIYNTAAEIELMSNTLEGNLKASEFYTKSIDFQENVAHQKNYVLLNAMIGIANIQIDLAKDTDQLLVARSRLEGAIELIQETWPSDTNTKDIDKCHKLLTAIETKLIVLGQSNLKGSPISSPQSE